VRLVIALCVTLAATPAFADPNAFIDVSDPPLVTATVFGNPNLETAKCTLSDGELALPARAAAPLQAKQSMAVVFVVLTNALFGGGLSSKEGWRLDATTWPLGTVEEAIDHSDLATLGSPASTFEIVGYSTGARIVKPATPLAELRGSAFGAAKDYDKELSNDLVAGIKIGLDELEHSHATRRVLIVIGDGGDTNASTARDALPELGVRARTSHVETYAIAMKTELSSDTMVLEDMIEGVQLVNSRAGFAAELSAVTAHIAQREAFEFTGNQLAWNGLRHDLVFACPGGLRVESTVLLPTWAPPVRRAPRLATWLLGAGALALVIALIARRRAA
jgi:hypothetical protein